MQVEEREALVQIKYKSHNNKKTFKFCLISIEIILTILLFYFVFYF